MTEREKILARAAKEFKKRDTIARQLAEQDAVLKSINVNFMVESSMWGVSLEMLRAECFRRGLLERMAA